MTDFTNKINILGSFYSEYRDDEELLEFFDFNDLGLPLAYLSKERLCEISDDGRKYVAETWDMFLLYLGIEDKGFETLEQVLSAGNLEGDNGDWGNPNE